MKLSFASAVSMPSEVRTAWRTPPEHPLTCTRLNFGTRRSRVDVNVLVDIDALRCDILRLAEEFDQELI